MYFRYQLQMIIKSNDDIDFLNSFQDNAVVMFEVKQSIESRFLPEWPLFEAAARWVGLLSSAPRQAEGTTMGVKMTDVYSLEWVRFDQAR